MENQNQVKKIIEYLQGKIDNLKSRLKEYDSPIMQEMAKTSPHLQMEYIRLTTELQANEDNLLAIKTFSDVKKEPEHKPIRNIRKKDKGKPEETVAQEKKSS